MKEGYYWIKPILSIYSSGRFTGTRIDDWEPAKYSTFGISEQQPVWLLVGRCIPYYNVYEIGERIKHATPTTKQQ